MASKPLREIAEEAKAECDRVHGERWNWRLCPFHLEAALQQIADQCQAAHAEDLEAIDTALDAAGVPQHDEHGESIPPETRVGMLRASVAAECAGVCRARASEHTRRRLAMDSIEGTRAELIFHTEALYCAVAIELWAQGERASGEAGAGRDFAWQCGDCGEDGLRRVDIGSHVCSAASKGAGGDDGR